MWQKLHQYGLIQFIQFACGEMKVRIWNRYVLGSFSQSKEDLVIDQLLQKKQKGFYVDIGAYDPIRFSNTMRFYKKGWHGINIEPNTEYYQRFLEKRPRDINCNIGIGPKKGTLLYYQMNPQTLSTFVKTQAEAYEKQGFPIVAKKQIPVLPLKEVFSTYKVKRIDFLSVDVEGFEMEVLASNDWKRFRPMVICIEVETPDERGHSTSHPVCQYLKKQHYTMVKDTGTNAFFVDTHAHI